MKTLAVICEYNPFHNGHAYQLAAQKQQLGCDCVVSIMSGHFVQRGSPAVCNKWVRTKMALLGGSDLVIELPVVYAAQSAERFARGAVALADSLGVVDFLGFGSECGDLKKLQAVSDAALLPVFAKSMRLKLKNGMSYPRAQQEVLNQLLGESTENLLSKPNNLLGIEYLKALRLLGSKLIPATIKRDAQYPCASLIRQNAVSGEYSGMPGYSASLLRTEVDMQKAPVRMEAFDRIFTYLLRTTSSSTLSQICDMTEGLENRFLSAAQKYSTAAEIAEAVKTKRYTRTRIDRVFINLLLGIRDRETKLLPQYIRVLGFTPRGKKLLAAMKERASLPVLTNLPDAPKKLSSDGLYMLQKDILATDVYVLAYPGCTDRKSGIDFQIPPVRIGD